MPENLPFDKFLAPDEPAEVTQKRLRGGQPGNHNALKHGLYVKQGWIRNSTAIELADLSDFNDIIIHYKQYMEHLFELGINSKDLNETNITLRSLALASDALTHLVNTQIKNRAFVLADDEGGSKKNSSFKDMYRGLLKSMSAYMDVSDLEASLEKRFPSGEGQL